MLTVCWAAKGGSGTTVVACALALMTAGSHGSAWLVDLAGDAPAALGVAEPSSPGVHDWLMSATAPPTALQALSVAANDSLRIIPRGTSTAGPEHTRWSELGRFLAEGPDHVVVDAGSCPSTISAALLAAAHRRVLVTRPCYLSLRRAAASGLSPTDVVIVHEPGRALTATDVAYAVHAPVVAEVGIDPSVARAVDAGLLAARLPKTLAAALRGLVP